MKVGDYVRTDYSIGKIIEILQPTDVDEPDLKLDVSDCNDNPYIFKSEVIKSSPNIIDLIEVGDYVNGMKITNIWIDKETNNIEFEFNKKEDYLYVKEWNYESRITKYKLKSIVTKEMFANAEYRVESKKI